MYGMWLNESQIDFGVLAWIFSIHRFALAWVVGKG
jgi:hypothetical protein